ncbi:MAG: LacI family DNA-binding transcriptional regulator [Spirochaetales bacterium]|uniref:LacI family DNA-binding transcriptional regulator n=1 Tax=Candidatus Thalassospirochaeta sargassi TaxID=3119039 RepID=A0AAJ1IGD8_9SPIO|nr:LacI family DNA-binding transcriptional regulator [Spirochaetales bacterium]
MPNIREVAKASGYSVATISRVINHPNSVSPDTREKVFKIMRDMEYTPNTHARGLALDKSNSIALILPDVLDMSYIKIARGIEEIAHQKGYFVFLCNSENNHERELENLDMLVKGRRVDGIILVNSLLSDDELYSLQKEKVPIVLAGRKRQIENTNAVYIDYARGSYNAAKHFISLGYRSLGFISNKSTAFEDEEKFSGFVQAINEHSISINENFIIEDEKSIRGGTRAAKKLLMGKSLPEALLVSCDPAALAVLKCLNENEIKVPEQIAIIGFDNVDISELVSPRLTTIAFPAHKLGLLSARLLFDDIDNRGYESQEIFLQTALNIRESCGHGRTKY